MKTFRKAASLFLTAVLCLSLSACHVSDSNAAYNVGICQLIEFDAHDDATEGFIDALNEALPGELIYIAVIITHHTTVFKGKDGKIKKSKKNKKIRKTP